MKNTPYNGRYYRSEKESYIFSAREHMKNAIRAEMEAEELEDKARECRNTAMVENSYADNMLRKASEL